MRRIGVEILRVKGLTEEERPVEDTEKVHPAKVQELTIKTEQNRVTIE